MFGNEFDSVKKIQLTLVALFFTAAGCFGWYNRANNQAQWAVADVEAGRQTEARNHVTEGLAYAERALDLNADDPKHTRLFQALEQLHDRL